MSLRQLLMIAGFFTSSALVAYAADGRMESKNAEDGPTGRWLTASGNLEVELAASGEGLTGTVVRVISNRKMDGAEAEAPTADSPPLMGLKILENLVPSGKNEWKGRIYNRDNGKTYDCLMTFVPPDQLNIRGYMMLPMFGKTQIWRRVGEAGQSNSEQSAAHTMK